MIIILFLVFPIIFILILAVSEYLTHVSMNKDQKLPYDWCNFKTFLTEFYKRYDKKDFEFDTKYKSIFLKTWDSESRSYIHKIYLHASIVKFDDNKCMILYPWSYYKYCRWLKNYGKSNRVKKLFARK